MAETAELAIDAAKFMAKATLVVVGVGLANWAMPGFLKMIGICAAVVLAYGFRMADDQGKRRRNGYVGMGLNNAFRADFMQAKQSLILSSVWTA